MTRSPALSPAFSLYLDAARFAAALAVLVAHLGYKRVTPIGPDYGREAVIVFFILSGLVIAHTARTRDAALGEYALARAARIYSVALPALLFGAAIALILHTAYGEPPAYPLAKPWLYLPLHLLFAGELWALGEAPPLLEPYWSLSYEVWYYVLFGCVFYLRGAWRWLAGILVLALMGPKLIALLPIWLGGALLYRLGERAPRAPTLAWFGWSLSLALLIAWGASNGEATLRHLGQQWWPWAAVPPRSADRYLADYLVALLVLANFHCARQLPWQRLQQGRWLIRKGARYSFALYLTHMPVIAMAQQWRGPGFFGAGQLLVLLAAVALTAILFGELGEWLRAAMLRWGHRGREAAALAGSALPPA